MKSHTKRILPLILVLILGFSLCAPAFAADGFSDVPSSYWAYNDIMACAEQGIVTGYGDGSFRPGNEVSGIQFIVMVTRTFFQEEVAANQADAVGREWYWPNTTVAELNGLSYGIDINDSAINRYDMAYVLYKTLVHFDKANASADAATASIKDWSKVPSDYQTAVKSCYALGILSGMSDGAFCGEQSMTRAQACTVIMRMMQLVNVNAPAAPVQPTTPVQPQQPEPPAEPETGNPAASNVTVEYALEVIAKFKEQYPEGTVWDDKGTNGNKYAAGTASTDILAITNQWATAAGPRASLVYGCGGWAAMISDAIFGQTGAPMREVTDPSKVRPGDICIRFNSKGKVSHIYIATSTPKNIDGYWVFDRADGNMSDKVDWTTASSSADGGYLWSNVNGATRAWTRYPEELSE